MTQNIFFIGDTHFGQHTMCKFTRDDGSKLRPFDTIEEMVKRWNEKVRPADKVYHSGDITMRQAVLPILSRLNGTKVLIKGNHDIYKLKHYTPYFKDIRGCCVKGKIIMTHIPIHPDSKGKWELNIHGHLHARRVMEDVEIDCHDHSRFERRVDPFYFCVSAENINYRPISYDEILKFNKSEKATSTNNSVN